MIETFVQCMTLYLNFSTEMSHWKIAYKIVDDLQKEILGRPADNIEMDLKKLGYNELEGIHVASEWTKYHVLVNTRIKCMRTYFFACSMDQM